MLKVFGLVGILDEYLVLDLVNTTSALLDMFGLHILLFVIGDFFAMSFVVDHRYNIQVGHPVRGLLYREKSVGYRGLSIVAIYPS
jgi:uncharacterized membrane protein